MCTSPFGDCLLTMVEHSLRLAEKFKLPLRVDWFVNTVAKPVINGWVNSLLFEFKDASEIKVDITSHNP